MDRVLCGICAWRRDCNKKFMHGEGIHCPDYTKDLTIRVRPEDKEEEVSSKPKGKAVKKKTDIFRL